MTHPLLKPKPLRLDDFHELLAGAPEDERWELIGGRVIRMMVGARWEHARIVSNLHIGIGHRLKARKSPCGIFSESFRVEVDDPDESMLPDIVVACSPLPPGATSLKTPTVLMEILSRGTEGHDRGIKWAAYQRISTLRHYVLVEREEPRIEVFDRNENGWSLRKLEGLGQTLTLPAIEIDIPLSEIYDSLFA